MGFFGIDPADGLIHRQRIRFFSHFADCPHSLGNCFLVFEHIFKSSLIIVNSTGNLAVCECRSGGSKKQNEYKQSRAENFHGKAPWKRKKVWTEENCARSSPLCNRWQTAIFWSPLQSPQSGASKRPIKGRKFTKFLHKKGLHFQVLPHRLR